MRLAGDLLLLIGALFMFLGALGMLRMPDVYTRLQAGTKAVTLGSMALLAGVVVHHPGWWPRVLLIALFVLLTSPLSSSTIARAALRIGIRPWHRGDRQGGSGA